MQTTVTSLNGRMLLDSKRLVQEISSASIRAFKYHLIIVKKRSKECG